MMKKLIVRSLIAAVIFFMGTLFYFLAVELWGHGLISSLINGTTAGIIILLFWGKLNVLRIPPRFLVQTASRAAAVVAGKKKLFMVLTTIALVLILIVGWFYWFEWRPARIRKNCSDMQYAIKLVNDEINRIAPVLEGDNPVNVIYRLCLVKHGLKPEPLLGPASPTSD